MRPGASTAIYSILLAFPTLLHATAVDCGNIIIDGVKFNVETLTGPHSVFDIVKTQVATKNITFTINVCQALGRSTDKERPEECENDSWICALERFYRPGVEGEPQPDDVWPIAGDFIHKSRPMDAAYTRLKNSASSADAEKEGFRLEMNGGMHEDVKQKAIIEFLCDPDKTGLEEPSKPPPEKKEGDAKRAEGNSTEPPPANDPNKGRSLQFISYNQAATGADGEEVGILRLKWMTKYACEGQSEKPSDGDSKKSTTKRWGFFTWFIVVLLLVVSAYLIFGSWLNYSRYGARGWDLLPHGDTLRDLPYLMRDWGRRAFSTVQGNSGGGGRGYSAI